MFDNVRLFEAFPINFQDTNGAQNDNIFALSRVLDYVFWLAVLEGKTGTPLADSLKRLYFRKISDVLDTSLAAEKAIFLRICDSIARDYNIKAYEYASEEYGYSSAEVLLIKESLIDEFWELNSKVGTPYAISRALEIFLFTSITVDENVTPTVRRDGTWLRNGYLTRSGTVPNCWAFHDIELSKPTSLSDAQAEVVARAVCEGYEPYYTRTYDITLI